MDKCPDEQSIGVGEVLRHCCKLLVMMLKRQQVLPSLCKSSGRVYEVAVHAMHQIFLDPETEGVLLVDVTNAFEQKDKQETFYNITLTDTDQHLYVAKHP